MSEMIERVAKAIWEKHRAMLLGEEWEELDRFTTERYRGYASAAIAAMREPTEAMEIAGHGTAIDVDGTTHMVSAKACWQAMVDEALK